MTSKTRIWIAPTTALTVVALLIVLARSTQLSGSDSAASPSEAPALPPPSNGAISPRDQADSLHLVIAADREMYCREFIARQSANRSSPNPLAHDQSVESWPLPTEMFRRAAESIQSQGAEFSYALRALNPIDLRNEPQTELERRGLVFVISHPTQNYYGREMLGGRRYFTAVYPDLPAAAACVDCHNRKTASIPRHQVGERLGGIVVRVPLEF